MQRNWQTTMTEPPEIESAVIGAMLARGNGACDELLKVVTRQDFTDIRWQITVDAIVAVKQRGEVADMLLVSQELERGGGLARVGATLLARAHTMDKGAAIARHYADSLARESFWREYRSAGKQIIQVVDSVAPAWRDSRVVDQVSQIEQALSTIETLKQQLTAAARRSGRFQFTDAQAMLEQFPVGSLDKLHEAVVGRLFRRGKLSMLSGPSKAGKSLFAIGLALHAAAGKDFLGTAFSVERPLRIVIVDAEMSRVELSERIHGMLDQYGISIPANQIDIICLLDAAGKRWRQLSIDDIRYDLMSRIKQIDADLFILDCLYALKGAGREENSNDDMAEVMYMANQIANETNAAGLLIHHAAKGSKADSSVTDAHAGAGVITRAITGTIITMREHERKEPFWSIHWKGRQVKSGKTVIEHHDDYAFRLSEGMDADHMSGSRAQKRTPQSMVTMEPQQFVDTYCPAEPLSASAICRMATKDGMSGLIANGLFRDALDQGLLVQTRRAARNQSALYSSDPNAHVEQTAEEKTREWFKSNPGATVRQAADACGVSIGTASNARPFSGVQ